MFRQVGAATPVVFQTTTFTGTPFSYSTQGKVPQVRIWAEIDLPAGLCFIDANSDTAVVVVNQLPVNPSTSVSQPTCAVPTGQITITK
jgi:hypothetical protein